MALGAVTTYRLMSSTDSRSPDVLDPDTVAFTVDVEWAAPAVLDDVRALFDQHGLAATFFVTHAGVAVPGHERGIHPNFRRSGDTYRALPDAAARSDGEVHEHVVAATLAFAPEAKGIRSHSLYYDSTLLPVYRRQGLEYDCSYQMPLVEGLRPFWQHAGMVAVPTYYADHLDIMNGITGFELGRMRLDRPGVKVLDFHPNLIYLNASSDGQYAATKAFYHDPVRLLAARRPGRGIRTFFLDLLAHVAARRVPTACVGAINAAWRRDTVPWPKI
jgi:peptidoglycan/xylan/chitin deacetylase (PgdA/CDA1 family)